MRKVFGRLSQGRQRKVSGSRLRVHASAAASMLSPAELASPGVHVGPQQP